ncbi:MAG TPA: OmpA family protein [Terriglobia bacterium]|nr:OmpA family protein [Terriglobia bacterium]
MDPRRKFFLATGILLAALFAVAAPAFSQKAKLKIHVSPKQAFVFVDGAALKQGSCAGMFCTIWVDPGEHTVTVRNYGYAPESQKVTLEAGKVTKLDVSLKPEGGPVSGPWGRIQIKGPSHAAVLLNGKSPDYFVGHVDEINNSFIWQQELLVHPGTYQVTVTWWGNEIWSGPVTVQANERVIVKVNQNGAMKTKPWTRLEKLTSPIPRFKAGISTSRVAVAPTTGEFSVNPASIKCGQSSELSWSSADSVENTISGIGKVGANGNQTVTPKQTTTYDFTAAGPGGIVKDSKTVEVDSAIQASLTMSPAEVRYHKVGDQVVEQGSATLSWSTTNAQAVSIDPLGTVDASGSKTITPTPKQTGYGTVDETDTYTLHATNECGGSATQTATLHIVGLIERAHVKVELTSVFFPTNWPNRHHKDNGLLRSQKDALNKLAQTFIDHHKIEPESRLVLEAHADRRGSTRYNQSLSEWRADIVKNYLVSQGVPADLIDVKALGKTQNLSLDEVKQLEGDNPNKPANIQQWINEVLAHNRRVDTVLMPDNLRSTPTYPYNAPDVTIIHMRPMPSLSKVKSAE